MIRTNNAISKKDGFEKRDRISGLFWVFRNGLKFSSNIVELPKWEDTV